MRSYAGEFRDTATNETVRELATARKLDTAAYEPAELWGRLCYLDRFLSAVGAPIAGVISPRTSAGTGPTCTMCSSSR